MNIKIFFRCSLFPSWSGLGLISTPVLFWTASNLGIIYVLQYSATSLGLRPPVYPFHSNIRFKFFYMPLTGTFSTRFTNETYNNK